MFSSYKIYRYTLLSLVLLFATTSLFAYASSADTEGERLIKRSTELTLISPDSSWRLLEDVRSHHMAPQWRIDMAEGCFYYYTRRYRRAEKELKRALDVYDDRQTPDVRLLLKRWLMKTYDVLQKDRELMYAIDDLRKDALREGKNEYAVIADFTYGKRLHYHGDKEEGYRLCWQAVKDMQSSNYQLKHRELFRFYTELVRMLIRDARYHEALQLSTKQEQEALRFDNGIRGMEQLTLRQTYANRTQILMELHRMADAEKAYAQWKNTRCGNAIDDKNILPYLMGTHRHEEALSVIYRYEDFLKEEGDSITMWMLSMRINEGLVTSHIGDFRHTKENFVYMQDIVDRMAEVVSRADMRSTYSNIKDRDMLDSRERLLLIAVVGGILLLIISLLVIYFNRVIWRRNLLLQRTLNGLAAYRNVSLGQNKAVETTEEVASDDERLFVEMDRRVTQERLFLNPTLSRDDLMAIMGVGKNRFVSIMGRYSDEDNVTQYINLKRLEYATQLMRQHPNYTLQAIMSECGITNAATFSRAFKHFYGVTPSEYRKNLETTPQNDALA